MDRTRNPTCGIIAEKFEFHWQSEIPNDPQRRFLMKTEVSAESKGGVWA